jgi:hypothetical protein
LEKFKTALKASNLLWLQLLLLFERKTIIQLGILIFIKGIKFLMEFLVSKACKIILERLGVQTSSSNFEKRWLSFCLNLTGLYSWI